ncbi:MAG: hypothetical protein JW973_16715 [Bacteroidales bacterium]|nr:hypothetical protein [Bacteroidales bacterium]
MKIDGFSGHPFWSYKKTADLPEDIVILQVVLYGEIRDMIQLTRLIERDRVDNILKQLSATDSRNFKRINFFQKVIFA